MEEYFKQSSSHSPTALTILVDSYLARYFSQFRFIPGIQSFNGSIGVMVITYAYRKKQLKDANVNFQNF